MTIAELYRYPTRHFDFHEQQLTLGDSEQMDARHRIYVGESCRCPPLTCGHLVLPTWLRLHPTPRRGFELTRLVDEVLSAKNFRPTCHFRCMRVGHSIMAEASIVQWT
ncbi:hypothetical protein [Rhodococcus sp. IEGM 1307]|uniref:hypothetical protein n=1 Tax=Rhodococcus sp. IEGM 1307 TaxID=3047091 RepID=UPI0024B6AAA4|nr:hypothetical protein [Rhodococcus sp. IEGM 1307]MDI9979274.1 hypothetical protein [Rhodococcus sp. IEGM 1307]